MLSQRGNGFCGRIRIGFEIFVNYPFQLHSRINYIAIQMIHRLGLIVDIKRRTAQREFFLLQFLPQFCQPFIGVYLTDHRNDFAIGCGIGGFVDGGGDFGNSFRGNADDVGVYNRIRLLLVAAKRFEFGEKLAGGIELPDDAFIERAAGADAGSGVDDELVFEAVAHEGFGVAEALDKPVAHGGGEAARQMVDHVAKNGGEVIHGRIRWR